ncbi:efflux RND transporter permease subunit [Acidisphaera sp. L21]|uniref:efflux RND transporter permease subunit n=1 Tax=Acidisphaera sp. L21 TaxID=1641851 RepID=UPI00131A895E|nr:efflux RND transporter permease subunit [Acidisphaera sp. L21]
MGLVKFALKFRVTIYVLSLLILLCGVGAIVTMPKDVLPNVDIPVVSVIWTYTGLDTKEMEQRVTTYSEFSLSNNVNGIKNIESQTLQGVTIEKIYFQSDVSIDLAITQIVSATNSIRAVMPTGIQPPIVVRYSASAVPVIQLALSSDKESEQALYDYGQYRVRQAITSTPGTTIPSPFGGKQRQVMVDLDLHALQGLGLAPTDVVNAISSQNLTEPSGMAKIGATQYPMQLNAIPDSIAALNRIPIKVVNGAPVLVQDVAYVRDGNQVQQNIVRENGRRSVLLTILKNGNASTLSVVNAVKGLLPGIRAAAPKDMKITPLFDQSVFVSGAINDVLREGGIAAGLTGMMILLFLGSWRSTLIVMVSIPLSILTSLAVLAVLGNTLNIMTLGGLALAVGILVDDATVAIENTYRLMEEGSEFKEAVVEGASGIAKPALISTLSICCAFVSVLFLNGAAKFLFTPQALAVVFAMLASYGLSRTLVPIMIDVLVRKEYDSRKAEKEQTDERQDRKPGLFRRIHAGFERGFEHFREGYSALLQVAVHRRWMTLTVAGATLVVGGTLFLFVGEDYFPQIQAGQLTLHVRGRSGLRIEETERLFQQVEDTIRQEVPSTDLVLDNIGLPANNYNLAFTDGSTVALNDGQILISLKPDHPSPAGIMRRLRVALRDKFPNAIFYFQPADIITQVLNFGLPAPIDIQVTGRDSVKNLQVAQELVRRVRGLKGAVDVHLQQIVDAPAFFVDVDRIRALQLGLTEEQVAQNLNTSLASSYQVTPNFWTDPKTGIPYQFAVQTPEYRTDSLSDVENTPLLVSNNGASAPNLLSNLATLTRQSQQTVANHENTAPAFDVMANVQDRPLGSIESDIKPIVQDLQKRLGPGNKIEVRGQILSKDDAFTDIALGLGVAMIAVYLLMALNYQTWGDPLVVLLALPMAFCGICASLFITQTTLSIPSLMGAIMSVGVASANSILLVTFAKEHREQTGCSAAEAAIEAGTTRLRPVLMTAGAMFVGLIPMALGLGEGSEQNAALARAVLGGVAVGTCSTLLFVPFLYSVLRSKEIKPLEDYI